MANVIVVGGGAAGMMCAALLAAKGHRVTLMEHNEKLGKKLFITGKGRCNFTNDCDEETFLQNVVSNPKFLYSAIYNLNPESVIRLFSSWGLESHVERGRRAFPDSNHSSDVIDMLKRQLDKGHVKILLKTEAREILLDEEGKAKGVRAFYSQDNGSWEKLSSMETIEKKREHVSGRTENYTADAVVIATGGLSYPSTGSVGDGYRFAKKLGLKVTPCSPSLVPIVCQEEYIREMQGLSLKNVELHVKDGKKEKFDEFGELMFTHFGITGPLVLKASAELGPMIGKKALKSWIDLKPAVSEEQLDQRFLRLFEQNPNKELKTVLHELYPAKMIPVIPEVAGVSEDKKVHDLTKEERRRLVETTKHFPLTMTALRGYQEAVVTKGGVSVRELDPGTMEVKKIPGLYYIGETVDLDGFTGGYNLQIAWSTAALAADAINRYTET